MFIERKIANEVSEISTFQNTSFTKERPQVKKKQFTFKPKSSKSSDAVIKCATLHKKAYYANQDWLIKKSKICLKTTLRALKRSLVQKLKQLKNNRK